ncbi:MAG: transporter substrate-binding domain-containing protein [Solirubrobacterales bacterium]
MSVEEKSKKMKSLSDIENATFAVVEGFIYDEWTLSVLPNARIQYYRTIMECITALTNGEVDAFPYDDALLRYLLKNLDESFIIINDDSFKDSSYGFAVNFDRPDLKKVIDDTIAEIKSNGIYDEMIKRWFPEVGAIGIMPNIKLDGKNGKLKFGTSTLERPFTFIVGDKETTGFDIELAKRVCQKLDMDLEIYNIRPFSEVIPALLSEKVDMIGAAIVMSEERAKKVLFSESYFKVKLGILIKK